MTCDLSKPSHVQTIGQRGQGPNSPCLLTQEGTVSIPPIPLPFKAFPFTSRGLLSCHEWVLPTEAVALSWCMAVCSTHSINEQWRLRKRIGKQPPPVTLCTEDQGQRTKEDRRRRTSPGCNSIVKLWHNLTGHSPPQHPLTCLLHGPTCSATHKHSSTLYEIPLKEPRTPCLPQHSLSSPEMDLGPGACLQHMLTCLTWPQHTWWALNDTSSDMDLR